MAKMSESAVPSLLFTETDDASITTPAAGKASLFRDTDNVWKSKDEAGTVAAIGSAVLFDSTVTGADAATIDTGASGIPSGYNLLEIWLYARTDEAVTASPVAITLNNDTTLIYDSERITGADTTLSAAGNTASAGWINNVAGASCAANVYGLIKITIPNYLGTVGFKAGDMFGGFADTTGANSSTSLRLLSYRSTSAITRLAATPTTAAKKLKVGSRLIVFGR